LLTLNQIHAQIVALANAHYQIAEVGMGTIAELQGKPDRNYPLLWLSNEGGSVEGNYKVDNIRLTMFGRVIVGEEGQDDDASEIEVLSDMQLILLDFLNYFHQQHGQEYVTDKAATLEHFTERTNDRTAGYSCVLELKQFYDWNKCQIPQSGATIPPSIDGLTLYDFCDASVIDRLTAEQVACLEAEFGQCTDATVEINSILFDTVASGATIDIPVINGGSNPVGSLQVTDWVIGNNMTTINGTQVTDQEAEVNAAIFATLDGSQSGTWNAGTQTWEMTSAPCADVTEQINGVTIGTAASGSTNNQVITDTATNPVGTAANPSVIADTSITSSLGNFTDTALAESTYTIANVSWTDSDGSPQSTEYSGSIVCAPPNYGTKILTVLQRQYGVSALWGFSYRELSDEYIDVDIVLFRRSGDNATASYTATEIIDGTLEAWVVAGGGTQHGYRVSFYDQTSNDRLLRISTAGNQPIIVESGILLVDSNGNPQERLTWTSAGNIQSVSSTFVYSGQVSRFGGMWHVGKRVVTASATYMIDSGGNPAVGIAQTSALVPNNGAAGTITVVNGTTLSPNTRTQLKTVTEGIETITFMKSLNWGASVWSRVGATISQQLAGSTFSETVAFNQNPSAYEALIQTDLNNYYAYY
jgi:hypothetical protein